MAKKLHNVDINTNIQNEDDHIIHLKHQVNISFDENYDYYLKTKPKKFFSKIFLAFAVFVLKIVQYFKCNFKVKNKQILKDLKKQKVSFVTVANHCLILDSPMIITTMYPRAIYLPTVEPTMKIPFVRHILRAANIMPIPFNAKGLVKFKNDCNELLQNGKVLHYFPEGALWPYYGKLRDFKPGAFRFAVENNTPILPFCIYFRQRKGIWKILGKKPLVTMEVLPPIYPNNELAKKPAINDLMQRTHEAMQVVMDQHEYINHDYDNIEENLKKANENQPQ